MDLVDYREDVFNAIKTEYEAIAEKLALQNVHYIPISAYKGDNVVNPSANMPWYKGQPVLRLLETLPVKASIDSLPMRLPVQYVIRPQNAAFPDYRAYSGRLASGTVRVGDRITVLPSYTESTVKAIDEAERSLTEAFAPQSVAVSLNDDVDVSRGNMLVRSDELPHVDANISLLVCWLNHRPLSVGAKYIIRHTTDEVFGIVRDVRYKVNINTLENIVDDKDVKMNDIAHIVIKTSKPLKYDYYKDNRITGSLVIIDDRTYETVGAGMLVQSLEEQTFNI